MKKLFCMTVLLVTGWSSHASAEIIAYEGFDYKDGTGLLVNGSGGTGFSGDWRDGPFNASILDDLTNQVGSLGFGALATSGGSVVATSQTQISGLVRDFQNPIGINEETIYMSFLARPESVAGQGTFGNYFGITLEGPENGPETFIGRAGDTGKWVIENRGGNKRYLSTADAVVDQTSLLVVKAEFGNTLDRYTLFVDPVLDGIEPAGGIVKEDSNMTIVTGLGIYYTGGFSIDEIRVGTTFASVTAIPEPSSLTAMSLIGAVVLTRRRKRR